VRDRPDESGRAGYELGEDGPFVLLLLIVAGRLSTRRRRRTVRTAAP
jgi:hypothetical protein